MWRNYYTPTTVEEALSLLAQYQTSARIIAGGTDLILELERHARPDVETLIDITRIPDLDQITQQGENIQLGALVSHNHAVGSDLVVRYGLPLAQASWEVGAPQIRNRATVAGNLITASPANDTITALLALDAEVTLRSINGQRQIKLDDFYPAYRQTAMQADEMLTAISFKALGENQAGLFLKLGLRRAQAISVIDVAVVLSFETSERSSPIMAARIAIGCVAPTVIRLREAEAYLIGQTLNAETITEAGRIASNEAHPIDDVRGTATYRKEMIGVYLVRTLKRLMARTERADWVENPAMLWGEHQAHVQTAPAEMTQHQRGGDDTIRTTVNGQTYSASGASHKTLLRFLREDLKLIGTKEGCAEGECGACTVFIDGVAVMACMLPAPRAHGAEIVTVEGLAGENGLHPIQQGFVEAGAVQCGFCTPGFLMAGAKLLEEKPHASREQIEQSISGNLCRCTGYYKILEAFARAQALQETSDNG